MPPDFLATIGIELIYSIVVIASSLIIYFSTREIYNLTSHKGIKYFRTAFLFFALSFFFRFIIKLVIVAFNLPRILNIHPFFFDVGILFLFMYASTMAMFYLLYSVMWKKLENNYGGIYILHLLALIIAFISISTPDAILLLTIEAIVLLLISIESYMSYRKSAKKKSHSKLYTIYLLLFVFWVLNIIDILVPNFFVLVQLIIFAASATLFLVIMYMVLRKLGSVK